MKLSFVSNVEIGSETLKTSLKLVEAYVLLGGKEFLDVCTLLCVCYNKLIL